MVLQFRCFQLMAKIGYSLFLISGSELLKLQSDFHKSGILPFVLDSECGNMDNKVEEMYLCVRQRQFEYLLK